jgi:uncharacterized protein
MIVMPKPLIAALSAIVFCLAVPATAQQTPVALAATPAPKLRPALWQISDADTTIYLFGTIHLLPRGMVWLEGSLADAIGSADELVTEIPEVLDGSVQSSLLDRAILPKGKSLRAMLTAPELAKFEATLRGFNLPIDSFDSYKPWYAAVVLATVPLLRDGFAITNGVETTLADRIRQRGRPRVGLETLDYQLGLFDSLPETTQLRYLSEVIGALPTLRRDVNEIVSEWGQGDAVRLAELMNAEEDDPEMVAVLLTNRNQIWARWIKQRLETPGISFVAVGAGHLGGPGSVQDQLTALGIVTKRVQ